MHTVSRITFDLLTHYDTKNFLQRHGDKIKIPHRQTLCTSPSSPDRVLLHAPVLGPHLRQRGSGGIHRTGRTQLELITQAVSLLREAHYLLERVLHGRLCRGQVPTAQGKGGSQGVPPHALLWMVNTGLLGG